MPILTDTNTHFPLPSLPFSGFKLTHLELFNLIKALFHLLLCPRRRHGRQSEPSKLHPYIIKQRLTSSQAARHPLALTSLPPSLTWPDTQHGHRGALEKLRPLMDKTVTTCLVLMQTMFTHGLAGLFYITCCW